MRAWRLSWKAYWLTARGDYASAKPVLTDLVSLDPNDGFALFMLAKCCEHEGQIVAALPFAQQAIRVTPLNLPLLQYAISLAIAAGEHELAATYVRQALSLPEMTTEMPQDLNRDRFMSWFLRFLSRMPILRRRFRPEKLAASLGEFEPGHRAVEIQQWKRWALEYLAWQSGNPVEPGKSVLH